MNFEERDSHWESFLQGKANLSQSFQKDTCCKVCLCLELLKLSTCKDSCYRPQEENDLIERLLQGILDPGTFEVITLKLREHLNNVVFISSLQDKIAELEGSVRGFSGKIKEINGLIQQGGVNKVEKPGEKSKLDVLVERIETYEDTLICLRKENEELRGQLKITMGCYEESVICSRKISNEIKSEFELIREEQNKLRAGIEVISKSVNDNALVLKELKSFKDVPGQDSEIKAFRLQIAEEVKEFNERTQTTVKKIQESGLESEKKIDETWSQIQDLKKDHEGILNWQKDCKLLTRHSSHLLSASDSVYSAMNQIQDFNHYLESRLENLNKEIELKVVEKREEWTHIGSYTYDEELQRFCWSCCKALQDGKGCEKR